MLMNHILKHCREGDYWCLVKEERNQKSQTVKSNKQQECPKSEAITDGGIGPLWVVSLPFLDPKHTTTLEKTLSVRFLWCFPFTILTLHINLVK